MKTSTRILTAILAAAMAATALVSCGDKESTSSTASSTDSKPSTSSEDKKEDKKDGKPLEFKVTTVGFGSSPEGKLIQNEWLRICGEKVGRELKPTYDFINIGDYSEKLKIICTGGDIPDLLSYGWGKQSDLIKWGEDGMFEEITQHMDKLPNYKKVLDSDTLAPYSVYSADGKLYAFYGATYQGDEPTTYTNGGASAIRKDILDKHGLALPNTIQEFYEVAKALKAEYPDIYPIILHEEWQQPENLLFSANHTSADRYFNGTEYVYGPTEDSYKEALMELNKWYTEGLISPDYFTHTSENGTAAVAAGEAFLIPSAWEGYPANWKNQYPDQSWVLAPMIKNEKYGEPWAFSCPNRSEWNVGASYSVVLSSKTKAKDDLLQLMDAQYSEEIVDLINWGVEGKTYQINADGEKEYIPEFIVDKDQATEFAFGQGSCRAGIFPSTQNQITNNLGAGRGDLYYNGEVHEDYRFVDCAKEMYSEEVAAPENFIIKTALTTDQNEDYANIMTPVTTFAKEQKVKFIKGERSFDEWDAYLDELNKMGDIQAAMDIYNANIVK